MILENISSPEDLKGLSYEELEGLAEEIREKIISTVSENGGHLGSNLGVVEATLAIHRSFSLPEDRLIFDVGHQCYAHKLITGRYDKFGSLRTKNGLSGFTKRSESEYDPFADGHCGTSLSAALGFAQADIIDGRDTQTVAFIGDGAFTNGIIYEALNNCGDSRLNLTIILNENEMSISPNVGELAKHLSKIRVSQKYFSFKHNLQSFLRKIPLAGESLVKFFYAIKNFFKRLLVTGNFFEQLGVSYIGPVDGNNIKQLEIVLSEAKRRKGCTLVHISTKKGRGYEHAEKNPEQYHSVGPFDITAGVAPSSKPTFSSVFGDIMAEEGEKRQNLCAITAAMCGGTGLGKFAQAFPERFFDTGIAEEHALTFSAGLAAAGKLPVFAVYSTFAQRIYDQMLHDCVIQDLHVILALDRAGLVPGDGVSHQGIFDIPLFSSLTGVTVYSPDSYEEMRECLTNAMDVHGQHVLRYPKGSEEEYGRSLFTVKSGYSTYGNGEKCIITYGRLTKTAFTAAANGGIKVIKLLKISPIDFNMLFEEIGDAKLIYLLEESEKEGSIAQKIAAEAAMRSFGGKTIIHAIDGIFHSQGSEKELMEICGFTAENIMKNISEALR